MALANALYWRNEATSACCFLHLLSLIWYEILHCTQLVDKSNDLSLASQLFYKQARKANSCCRFM